MKLSLYLLSFALMLLPVAVWAEHTSPGFWQQRLFARSFNYQPGKQELVHATGTFIPAHITEDVTVTAKNNPVILRDSVMIAPGAKLTIEEGTKIYTHEFSHVLVEGTLVLAGTDSNPVQVYSNHRHSSKTAWNGFMFQAGSTGSISNAVIRHGSPAITCLENSHVAINHTRMTMGEAGLFTSSDTCTLEKSTIHGVRDGIITTLPSYTFENSRVSGTRVDLKVGKELNIR